MLKSCKEKEHPPLSNRSWGDALLWRVFINLNYVQTTHSENVAHSGTILVANNEFVSACCKRRI